jgi:hypothetical protein
MASLTVQQVAQRAGASGRTVRRWRNSGKLAGTLSVDGWSVDYQDLTSFLDVGRSAASGPDRQVTSLDGLLDLLRETTERAERNAAVASMWQTRAELLQAELEQLRLQAPMSQAVHRAILTRCQRNRPTRPTDCLSPKSVLVAVLGGMICPAWRSKASKDAVPRSRPKVAVRK